MTFFITPGHVQATPNVLQSCTIALRWIVPCDPVPIPHWSALIPRLSSWMRNVPYKKRACAFFLTQNHAHKHSDNSPYILNYSHTVVLWEQVVLRINHFAHNEHLMLYLLVDRNILYMDEHIQTKMRYPRPSSHAHYSDLVLYVLRWWKIDTNSMRSTIFPFLSFENSMNFHTRNHHHCKRSLAYDMSGTRLEEIEALPV